MLRLISRLFWAGLFLGLTSCAGGPILKVGDVVRYEPGKGWGLNKVGYRPKERNEPIQSRQ